MRAKDEFRYIAETYNTKLLLERVVDGKLMCPEACCGSPVLECKCGEDCEHCNCFMIQKAIKSNGLTDKLLKEFYKMRDPDGDGSWPDDDDDRDHPDWGEPEYGDRGTGEIGFEDNEEIDIGTMVTWNQDGGPMKGEVVDVDVEQGFAVIETGFADGRHVVDLGELTKAIPRKPRPLGYPTEDNEEPRRGISGMRQKLDALAAAQLAGSKHKPYVSSFVGDGGKKIFAILGSDGKIVHKTHNKQEAHQWLKDNYENI